MATLVFPRWHRWLIGMAALLLTLTQAIAQPLQPAPTLSARILDQSGTLSTEEIAAIEARLFHIESHLGSQIVVLMLPSTAPESIATYAHRVASDWKIGRKDVGDGLLIVIAKNDRRMRIEVARALEGAIPDVTAARIIDAANGTPFPKQRLRLRYFGGH